MTDLAKPALDAVKALLDNADPTRTVYVSGITDADEDIVFPYLVLWPSSPARTLANLAGTIRPARVDIRVVGCGRDSFETLTVLDRASDTIVGQRLVIDGWGPGFIRQVNDSDGPISESREVLFNSRPTFEGATMWRFTAEPAAVIGS